MLHAPMLASAQSTTSTIYTSDLYRVLGTPIDFTLFALTPLGVALFHAHTLRGALAGAIVISLYKIAFTGFKFGPGVSGWVSHVGHEWVNLTNLLRLLIGFASLSRHFEKSHVPVILPKYLPDDWKGAFVMLIMVFVSSSFLDNIAASVAPWRQQSLVKIAPNFRLRGFAVSPTISSLFVSIASWK